MYSIDPNAPPMHCCFCGKQINEFPLDLVVSPGDPDGKPKELLAHNDCFKQKLHPSARYLSWHDIVQYG